MQEIKIPLEFSPEGELQKSLLEQLYYVHPGVESVGFSGTNIILGVAEATPADEVRTHTLEIVRTTLQSFKKVENRVVYESDAVISQDLAKDPHAKLFESGDMLPSGVGNFVYQGFLLKTLRALDASIRDLAFELDAIEQDYPTTVPVGSLMECGYVSNFPQHAMFVANAHRNFEGIRKLGSFKDSSTREEVADHLDHPHSLLSPTVCYHCFEAFKHKSLPKGDITFTATAKCHRHEYKTVHGLERLNTFTMRELIFFGSKDFVMARKQKIQERMIEILNGWDLKFRILGANDPFFATSASNKRTYQSLFDLKQEMQVLLPHNNKWLAVGSLNNHLTGLVKGFGITSPATPTELNSGCVGIGFERLALGLFSQKGLDPKNWAPSLRDAVLTGKNSI